MLERVIELPLPYDFWQSVRDVGPVAAWDGRATLWWATHTPDGPATLRLARTTVECITATAWGDGDAWMIEQAPRVLGLDDHPETFAPEPGLVHDLHRRARGVRMGRTDRVLDAAVAAIFGQKVQSDAARHSLRLLAQRHGEAAPGPCSLQLLPSAAALAQLDYSAFHPCNVERARADRVLGAARRATWLEAQTDPADLQKLPGIGPWSAAVIAAGAWGDADAVPVGDFHLPNTVCWALAREPRGNDDRMLELLAPYVGHRGRVIRLLHDAHLSAPKRGPRLSISDFRRK